LFLKTRLIFGFFTGVIPNFGFEEQASVARLIGLAVADSSMWYEY
jgi:hypothetical protein